MRLTHLVFAAVLLPACSSCSTLTQKDQTDVATFVAQQSACVAATPHDTAAIDKCRAEVKAKWCAKWSAQFDAEVCP